MAAEAGDVVIVPDEAPVDDPATEDVAVKHDAGKERLKFRDYTGDKGGVQIDRVRAHYTNMRKYQCVEFVDRMKAKWCKFDKARMTIWEAFTAMESFVDASDPDTESPNLEHMLQTAEGLRKAGYPDWMQLTGLLHDLGKVQGVLAPVPEEGTDGTSVDGQQWALGGDTWVVGVPIPGTAEFPELSELNPDKGHPIYDNAEDKPCGMYEPHCGIANLQFAWGHDEYMYQVLKHNCPDFPEIGLACIRYHSCYPLHRDGEYKELLAPGDEEMLAHVRAFNEFDLYTKADEPPVVEELRGYYQDLIDKYCPGELEW